MKQKILIDYLWNFRSKIVSQKNKLISQYKGRSDFQNLLVVDPREETFCFDLAYKTFEPDFSPRDSIILNKPDKLDQVEKKAGKQIQTIEKLLKIIKDKNAIIKS